MVLDAEGVLPYKALGECVHNAYYRVREAPEGRLADSLNAVIGVYPDDEICVYYERFDALNLQSSTSITVFDIRIRPL